MTDTTDWFRKRRRWQLAVALGALAATAFAASTLVGRPSAAQPEPLRPPPAPPPTTTQPPDLEAAEAAVPEPGPLPRLDAPNPALVELGRMLFFDMRLSGDATMSCATCHNPTKGWADGTALSAAYPGAKGFRNTPTILNAAYRRFFFWDGRLSGRDRPTMVRDQITDTHVLNMDGRLMLERLKQVPEYVERFNATQGGEPSFGRTLSAVAAFVQTVVSRDVPFDSNRMSGEARRGYGLFRGRGGCIQCHNGPYFSDGRPHATGAPDNPDLFRDPMRHFTLRAFLKFMGVPGFETARTDPGYLIVTKEERHRGAFMTPTLRELTWTAPYMHSGMLATLEDVVAFYDAGGGPVPTHSPLLRPLGLSQGEKQDLVAFLRSLSGSEVVVEPPELPEYRVQHNWAEVEN